MASPKLTGRLLWSTIMAFVGAAILLGASAAASAAPASEGHAKFFYVSIHGSDGSSGRSPRHPFRHISRCAELAEPGDTCFIMGGTYRETIRPVHSGTDRAPITYRPYRGQRVVVSGADRVQGWQRVSAGQLSTLAQAEHDSFLPHSPFAEAVRSGHIYSAHTNLNPALAGNEVFYTNQRLPQAQWPYPGTDPSTPATIEYARAGTTNTKIADPKLNQPTGYWDGASIYTEYWFISQTGTVSASQTGSLTLSNLPDSGGCVGLPPNNTRYYLFGQLKMLSHPGEWFYDAAAHQLYVWTPAGKAPASGDVQAKQRTYAFDLGGISHTRIEGLHLFANTIRTGPTSTGDTLASLEARYISEYQTLTPAPRPVNQDVCSILTAGENNSGIIIEGTHNKILDSTIAGSAGNGIALLGNHNSATGNVIHDVDAMGSYAAGVNLTGNHQTVAHNTIYRTGRSGITTDWHINGYASHDNSMAYNNVSAFDRLNVDSAGIYVCCQLDMTGTKIDHNWLHSPTPLPGVDPWAEAGFYTDTSSSNATVYDNVGWDDYVNNAGPGSTPDITPVAIFINGGGGNKLYNNDGPVQGAYNPDDPNDPNTVENNIGTVYRPTEVAAQPDINHNLPSSVDPQYVDPARNDYRLKPSSPARNMGIFVPGITVGGTDPQPSLGAYQYGGTFWQAGSFLAQH